MPGLSADGFAREYPVKRQSNERRQFPRVPVVVSTLLQFLDEELVRGTTTENLSIGGARFTTRRSVKAGNKVEMELQLEPTSFPIRCKGTVRWSIADPEGISTFGVHFSDLPSDERDRLEHYLAKVQKGP